MFTQIAHQPDRSSLKIGWFWFLGFSLCTTDFSFVKGRLLIFRAAWISFSFCSGSEHFLTDISSFALLYPLVVMTFWVFPILTISFQQLWIPLDFNLHLIVFVIQYASKPSWDVPQWIHHFYGISVWGLSLLWVYGVCFLFSLLYCIHSILWVHLSYPYYYG